MSSAVNTFRIVQGEWLFKKILNHLDLTEDEFANEYEEKLNDDPTCLNDTIVDMIHQNIKRGRENASTNSTGTIESFWV